MTETIDGCFSEWGDHGDTFRHFCVTEQGRSITIITTSKTNGTVVEKHNWIAPYINIEGRIVEPSSPVFDAAMEQYRQAVERSRIHDAYRRPARAS